MKKQIKIIAVTIACAFLLSCGVIINSDKFDSEKWKSGNARDRGKMVYDLRSSKILLGKTRREVDELLGGKYEIDTRVPTDIYLTIRYDEATERAVSVDIGD
jgi:hypothetical protein